VIYRNVLFPLMVRMDAERTHDRIIRMLELAQRNLVGRSLIKAIARTWPLNPVKVFGLNFPNIIGMAAGFDKDARVPEALALLGFGHIEVGTFTPRYQGGNPKPRVFRLREDKAIINRMGFPNCGIDSALKGLQRPGGVNRKYVLGASIGKQMGTPLEQAHEDYAFLMDRSFEYVDYFAINISSPNTPRLRELQKSEQLEHLLKSLQLVNKNLALQHETQPKPLLLKISPDLSWDQLDAVMDTSLQCGISGIIATNTTTDRTGLTSGHRAEIGGLSGRPLIERSNKIISYITRNSSGRLPVIGVGGVFDVNDVKEKIDAGAVLVQIFTGFIYQGPGMVGKILRTYGS